jgi:hypothetical protein
MATRRKAILAAASFAALGLALPLLDKHSEAKAAPPEEKHPVIHQALQQLRSTREILVREAAHDFHGHRVAAIKHIDAAIEELELALKSDQH